MGIGSINCPECNSPDSKVVSSKHINEKCRRRRQCLNCGRKYTTYEGIIAPAVEESYIYIIKAKGEVKCYYCEILIDICKNIKDKKQAEFATKYIMDFAGNEDKTIRLNTMEIGVITNKKYRELLYILSVYFNWKEMLSDLVRRHPDELWGENTLDTLVENVNDTLMSEGRKEIIEDIREKWKKERTSSPWYKED